MEIQSNQPVSSGGPLGLGVIALMDRILAILPEAVTESEKLRSYEFREALQKCRREIQAQKPLEPIAQRMFELCQDYFQRAKVYRVERERGYGETIEVLREAVAKLAGESATFNSQVINTSARFGHLTDVDDIREIKEKISIEVQSLRRAVEEKQKQDEEHLNAMERRVEDLETNLTRAKDEAALDPLTRLANRGSFDKLIARWAAEHGKGGGAFVLVMADIDDFKDINDTYGHQVGDRVLMGAGQLLSNSVRPTDFIARYGGEEFAILLSKIDLSTAVTRIEQLVKAIAAYRFRFEGGSLQFTLSCGVAEFTAGDTVESVVQRADEALYEAKRKGKNRVISRKKSRLKIPW